MIRNLLVLPSGEEIFSGQVGENAIISVTVTGCVNSEEELTPGAVCASMLEASVIVQKPLVLTAGEEVTLYTVSDSGQREKTGVFIAQKPVWESANRYALTAYDRVSRLDKDLTQWVANLSGWPYPLLDFASMVCSECGLELITEEIPNGTYPVQAFSGEGITGRQIMSWVGQAAGRFCRATKEGQIEFTWYENTGKVIGSGEKIIQTGPEGIVALDQLRQGAQLQAVSQIKPSLSGKESVKLFGRGRNVLDIHTQGIYHSNNYTNVVHEMKVTDTGIRLDIINRVIADKTLWGFCLGTVEQLAGKTITASADFTTSRKGTYATPYLGFFSVDKEPVFDPRENFSAAYGGFLSTGSFQQLSYSSGAGARTVTYTVTGAETKKYIAILFAVGDPGKTNAVLGDWTQWDNIQVEYADTATAYQSYTCNEFTRTFPAVYGGSLDWSTGVLTVTHGKIDKYAGEKLPDGWISSTGELTSGAQVVYPLAEPYTVQLPPQNIYALEGRNYLWSDTGDTTAGFRQDYYFLGSLSYEDYQVAPVEKVQIRLTDTDVGAVYPDDPQLTNAYILSGNYLLTNADAQTLETVAQQLYQQMKDITYTPCTVEVPANIGVKAGDVVTVTDKSGKDMTVYVMNHTRTGQRDTLECTGSSRRDSTAAVNRQSYKALSGKVLELQTDIEGLKVAHQDARGELSSLELTIEGIATEVSRQQTNGENLMQQMTQIRQTADQVSIAVQEIANSGVSKVRTQMGYTFDDEGLKISRSDAEMTNLLDNTGMYVRRGSDTVLQANNEGVEAMNITVRHYLSVGQNTRFEDYNNGSNSRRTACFFTGG